MAHQPDPRRQDRGHRLPPTIESLARDSSREFSAETRRRVVRDLRNSPVRATVRTEACSTNSAIRYCDVDLIASNNSIFAILKSISFQIVRW
jgi:hypothetical protein